MIEENRESGTGGDGNGKMPVVDGREIIRHCRAKYTVGQKKERKKK